MEFEGNKTEESLSQEQLWVFPQLDEVSGRCSPIYSLWSHDVRRIQNLASAQKWAGVFQFDFIHLIKPQICTIKHHNIKIEATHSLKEYQNI